MIPCCISECTCTFESPDQMIMYLKSIHKPPVSFRYKCTFPACIQIFSNLYGYTRHLKNHKSTLPNTLPISTKKHEANLELELPLKVRKTVNTKDNVVDHHKTTFEDDLSDMQKSSVAFTLNLHQRANFSRTDVREIQKATQKFCSNAVENIEKLNIIAADPDSNFMFKYLSQLKSNFDFIDSDYKFFKHIEGLGIFKEPIVMTLDQDESKQSRINECRRSCL